MPSSRTKREMQMLRETLGEEVFAATPQDKIEELRRELRQRSTAAPGPFLATAAAAQAAAAAKKEIMCAQQCGMMQQMSLQFPQMCIGMMPPMQMPPMPPMMWGGASPAAAAGARGEISQPSPHVHSPTPTHTHPNMKEWRSDVIALLTKESHQATLQKLNAAASGLGLDFHADIATRQDSHIPSWEDARQAAPRLSKLDFGRVPLPDHHIRQSRGASGAGSSARQLCIRLRNSREETVMISQVLMLPHGNPHFEWHYAVGQGLSGWQEEASSFGGRQSAHRMYRRLQASLSARVCV